MAETQEQARKRTRKTAREVSAQRTFAQQQQASRSAELGPTRRQQQARAEAGGREVARQRRAAEQQDRSRQAERDHAAGTSSRPAASTGRSQSRSSSLGKSSTILTPQRSNYQPIILVEFIAAVVLIAATPFAKKNQQGISPYGSSDIMQLGAITLLYFLLALISVGGRGPGRVAAWFGGLVLITVGLGEAASIAKTLDVLGTSKPAAAEGSGGSLSVPATGGQGG
jgi:hypothetical protein